MRAATTGRFGAYRTPPAIVAVAERRRHEWVAGGRNSVCVAQEALPRPSGIRGHRVVVTAASAVPRVVCEASSEGAMRAMWSKRKTKIDFAVAVTYQVQTDVTKTLESLERRFSGRVVNGYGVYADPAAQRAALRVAVSILEAALKLLEDTEWPSVADYDPNGRRDA